MANPFIIGRGSEVTIALLEPGVREEVVPQTITVGITEAAALATTITVTALTEPLVASLLSPVFLAFEDAVTGGERFVKVTAPAADGATTLTVEPLKRAIAPASTARHPVKLQARTSADLSTTANDITSSTFDQDGYVDGIVASIGYGLSCPGNFIQLDAGFRTAFFAFNEFREVWVTLKMPTPGGGYTSGYIFKGAASVTDLPIADPADGVISANATFSFRGKLIIEEPK